MKTHVGENVSFLALDGNIIELNPINTTIVAYESDPKLSSPFDYCHLIQAVPIDETHPDGTDVISLKPPYSILQTMRNAGYSIMSGNKRERDQSTAAETDDLISTFKRHFNE